MTNLISIGIKFFMEHIETMKLRKLSELGHKKHQIPLLFYSILIYLTVILYSADLHGFLIAKEFEKMPKTLFEFEFSNQVILMGKRLEVNLHVDYSSTVFSSVGQEMKISYNQFLKRCLSQFETFYQVVMAIQYENGPCNLDGAIMTTNDFQGIFYIWEKRFKRRALKDPRFIWKANRYGQAGNRNPLVSEIFSTTIYIWMEKWLPWQEVLQLEVLRFVSMGMTDQLWTQYDPDPGIFKSENPHAQGNYTKHQVMTIFINSISRLNEKKREMLL